MNRDIYIPAVMLGEQQQTALRNAWLGLVMTAASPDRHVALRRIIAEDARRLVDAFGQRIDGKIGSPFGRWLPTRLRCGRCHHTPVTRGPFAKMQYTFAGYVTGAWFCADCLPAELRVARGPHSSFENVEVVGAKEEASCAA